MCCPNDWPHVTCTVTSHCAGWLTLSLVEHVLITSPTRKWRELSSWLNLAVRISNSGADPASAPRNFQVRILMEVDYSLYFSLVHICLMPCKGKSISLSAWLLPRSPQLLKQDQAELNGREGNTPCKYWAWYYQRRSGPYFRDMWWP